MIIFAIRLSKSVPITVACEGRRWLSTLMPFPAGKRNDLILPTLSVQSFETSSAVTLSCTECIGGGVSGFSERCERPSDDRGVP